MRLLRRKRCASDVTCCVVVFLDDISDFVEDKEACVLHLKNLVSALPEENYHALKYLSNFLHRVSLHEGRNRMNSSSLGIVFGPNLFRYVHHSCFKVMCIAIS